MRTHPERESVRVIYCREGADQPEGCPLCIARAENARLRAAIVEWVESRAEYNRISALSCTDDDAETCPRCEVIVPALDRYGVAKSALLRIAGEGK